MSLNIHSFIVGTFLTFYTYVCVCVCVCVCLLDVLIVDMEMKCIDTATKFNTSENDFILSRKYCGI